MKDEKKTSKKHFNLKIPNVQTDKDGNHSLICNHLNLFLKKRSRPSKTTRVDRHLRKDTKTAQSWKSS